MCDVPIKSYSAVKSKMGRNSIFKDVDELGEYIIGKAKSIKPFSEKWFNGRHCKN